MFAERGHVLRRCVRCGLFFIDPYPDARSQTEAIVADYNFGDLEVAAPETYHRAEVSMYDRFFPAIAEECAGAHRVLDVGCGTGHLLERLGASFPTLYRAGIELNPRRAAMARRYARCDVQQVPIEHFASDVPFDVVTMINVISHIPSFDALFASVRRLLEPTGRFIIKTGEVAPDVRKRALFDWSIPDHLHFLGLETLAVINRKYGFRTVRHDRTPYAAEAFSAENFRAPGRSAVRNALKRGLLSVPLALPAMRRAYEVICGRAIFSSFIVLSPDIGTTRSD